MGYKLYEPKTTEDLINRFSAEFNARLMAQQGVRIAHIERHQNGPDVAIVYRLTDGQTCVLMLNPDNGTFWRG